MHLNFLSDWPPNPRAENKIRMASPFLVSPLLCTCFNFLSFFHPNMERSQRTATRIVQAIFALEQKKKAKNKTVNKTKKIQSNDRKFVLKQCIKSLYVHYGINQWEKPVTTKVEME